eukprot:GHVN01002483.1.p2 GENE.GHVN01002483.1~~GHVN01002483.1.p2  ORF type:complete len:165 (+),score=22.03 GHVN01002483.1:286-780(+)
MRILGVLFALTLLLQSDGIRGSEDQDEENVQAVFNGLLGQTQNCWNDIGSQLRKNTSHRLSPESLDNIYWVDEKMEEIESAKQKIEYEIRVKPQGPRYKSPFNIKMRYFDLIKDLIAVIRAVKNTIHPYQGDLEIDKSQLDNTEKDLKNTFKFGRRCYGSIRAC